MIIITKKLHPRRLTAGCLLGACAVILLGAAFGVVEAVPLPTKFDAAYQAYLTLQRSQGFDLEKYAGETIKRYTYQVKNYPGLQENIWACLLVCKHQIIGGEIFCNQGDGFTQSLEFPMKAGQ